MQEQKISIKTGRKHLFIAASSIIFVKADNIYSSIHIKEGKNILASNKIGDIEKSLNGLGFFKPHRSYLINLSYVEKYSKAEAAVYIQGYNNPVPVSRTCKRLLEKLLLK